VDHAYESPLGLRTITTLDRFRVWLSSFVRVPLAVGAFGLAVGAVASAQVLSIPARADRVLLAATVVDGKGRPVRDLKANEVRIFEEGKPQILAHFTTARDLRARVLLLVDASGSMNQELKATSSRMAALQVMAALGPEDETALAGFDSEYWGIVQFTRDRELIKKGLLDIIPFGSTALHDALDKAARDIAAHGEGRRAVVVITDGIDTSSQRKAFDVIARSRALDVPIYAVSVISPLDDPASKQFLGNRSAGVAAQGASVLSRYATLSGGAAFAVSDFAGLRRAADQIANELKTQYRLGYDPPVGPSRFRRVQVKTTRKGVVVRTRSGYVPS
jgi:Ca-activated chloride channel homolog